MTELTLKRGIRDAVPIVLGYLPLGAAYGVLARQAGLTVSEVVAMSLIVFAGSSQFVGASMIGAGIDPWTISVTTFLVNLRHALMSASLVRSFRKIPRPLQAVLAFWITDESFVVCSTVLRDREATVPYAVGLELTGYLAWAAGSLAGAVLSGLAPSVAGLGLDFALPAMFLALLSIQLKDRSSVVVALLSAGISVGLALAMPGHANVIVAAVVAATVGVFLGE